MDRDLEGAELTSAGFPHARGDAPERPTA
jgi:hypothetical protein